MKKVKLFKLLLTALMLFFFLQLTSHIFLKLGLNKETPPRSGLLKASALVFPLDAELVYEHAFALLEEHAYLKGAERPKLNDSVKGFKRAIQLNPLLYNAHFNLAKAYQLNQSGETTLYDDVLKYLKRASYIRGVNPKIGVELLKFTLSLWPLLLNEDKKLLQNILSKSVQYMNGNDFKSIVELWSVYNKDANFFKKSLIKKPIFFKKVANAIGHLEINLNVRQNFLSNYEEFYINHFKKIRLPLLSKKSYNRFPTIKAFYDQFKTNVPGYFQLTKNDDFDLKLYWELRLNITEKIIIKLSETGDLSFKGDNKKIFKKYILDLIRECDSNDYLKKFYQFLMSRGFLSNSGLNGLYLQLLIRNQMNDNHWVIQRGEDIRQSMSFVREEQREDYTKILILMAEGYLQSNQINRVEEILEEAEKINPEEMEVYWLRKKMERIQEIEERKSEARNPKSETSTNDQNLRKEKGERRQEEEGKEEKIKNSSIFDLKSTRMKKTVYFMDDSVLVLNLSEAFKEKIKDKHLLQVFVDGWIVFEQYLGQVKAKVEVKVKDGEWKKVEVEVRIR